jgi:hypothetical protein
MTKTKNTITNLRWDGDTLMANEFGEWFELCDVVWSEDDQLKEENKRIIAAAPLLLDALENMTIAVGMGWDMDGVTQASRAAAIAARGDVTQEGGE